MRSDPSRPAGMRQRHPGQAAQPAQRLEHIGTGDMLRDAIRQQTPAGSRPNPSSTPANSSPTTWSTRSIADRFRRDDRPETLRHGRLPAHARPGRVLRRGAAPAVPRPDAVVAARGGRRGDRQRIERPLESVPRPAARPPTTSSTTRRRSPASATCAAPAGAARRRPERDGARHGCMVYPRRTRPS